MALLLFLVALKPIETIHLDKSCNSVEVYDNKIYLAPFTGNSVFQLDESQCLKPVTFTDDVNYRIYNFCVTPFAIYVNNGKSIEKFYLASGIKEPIYSYRDISSFIITSSEEIIFSDRQKHELIYLDFTNTVRLKKEDLHIKDLYLANNLIYILTKNSILIGDEHGNLFEERDIPEKFDKILVDSTDIMLLSSGKEYFHKLDTDLRKIELSHGIRDIAVHDQFFVVLDENGSTLHLYSKSRIK